MAVRNRRAVLREGAAAVAALCGSERAFFPLYPAFPEFVEGGSMIESRPLFTLRIELHPIQEVGRTPLGHRRVVPVSGGRFEGERLRGAVLPHAGSDWLLTRADGSFQQDVRLTLETNDGDLILMSYRGVRHSSADVRARIERGESVRKSEYYLRIAPFFETASEQHAWLNTIVAIGVGERLARGVSYDVFEVL
jgi:hypothetical protein